MSKINKITPLTNVKFLNLYELEAENKFGRYTPLLCCKPKRQKYNDGSYKESNP